MTRVAPPPPPIEPFVYSTTPTGWTLTRPDTRADRLLRRLQRFLSVCLVALAGGLIWSAALMDRAGDIVIAAALALTCLAGAAIVGWWMSVLGARQIVREADALTVRTTGFFGVERTHTARAPLHLRAAARTVRGRSGPARGYDLTLETVDGALSLGFVPTGAHDPTTALATLLGAELHIAEARR